MDRKDGTGSRNQSERHRSVNSCGRPHCAHEAPLKDASLDQIENAVLEVSRYYWQAFAIPASQSWLRALHVAERRFGAQAGGEVGLGVLAAVQAMRMSRFSCFRFNNPACEDCASILSDDERRFVDVFRDVRRGSLGSATTHAMILCEGNDTSGLIHRMADLVRLTCSMEPAARAAIHRSRAAADG